MDPDNTLDEGTTDTAADQAAAEAAFTSGFNGDTSGAVTPAPSAPAPAPEPSPAPTPAPEPAPAPPADPYAGLPEDVREQLARIPELEHTAASANGRVAALNRQLEEARRKAAAAEPAAAPPPEPESLRKVREQLPEVAEAIDHAVKAATAARPAAEPATSPAPAPNAAPAPAAGETDEAALLASVHADWAPTMQSTDFKLWLNQQSEAERMTVLSTDKAIVVAAALTKFKAARAAADAARQAADETSGQRRGRVAAGVRPSGAGGAPRPTTQTDEEAFLAGYNGR